MIRQAISCDICGAEKKQTNHWFVAWEQAGELRVSGWNSRNRLRTGSKHLCGQACMHKLADDFMARVIAQKVAHKVVAAGEMEDDAEAIPIPVATATGRDVMSRQVMSRDAPSRDVTSRDASIHPPLRPSAARSPSAGLNASSSHSSSKTDASLTAVGSPSLADPFDAVESSARLLPPAQVESTPPAAGLVTMRERPQAGALPLPPDEPPRFATRNWRAEAWQRERERTRRAAERRPEIVARRMGGGD